MTVAIDGFGRIGRTACRQSLRPAGLQRSLKDAVRGSFVTRTTSS